METEKSSSGARAAPAKRTRARAVAQPAESRFLAQWQSERKTVEIFLINGVRIEGRIISFDPQVVLVESETTDKVYKTAISTIQEAKKRAPPRGGPETASPARKPTVVVKRVRRAPPR